jgi:SAM-dependent methyltransferase
MPHHVLLRHMKKAYHFALPMSVREWIWDLRHPDSRLEKYFEYRELLRAYIERLVLEKHFTGTVLEIGSGQDTHTSDLFRLRCPQTRFLRSDYSTGGYGRSGGGASYSILCDVTSLGVRSASLDGVICSEVLEHVVDYTAAIREMTRVLKPGGRLLTTTPFLYPLHGPEDYWRFTPQTLEILLRDHYRILDINLVPLQRARTCPLNIGILAERR